LFENKVLLAQQSTISSSCSTMKLWRPFSTAAIAAIGGTCCSASLPHETLYQNNRRRQYHATTFTAFTSPILTDRTLSRLPPHRLSCALSSTSSREDEVGIEKSADTTINDDSDVSASPFATSYHAPVMWKECRDALFSSKRARQRGMMDNDDDSSDKQAGDDDDPHLIFVDGTLGGGGHSESILQQMKPGDVLFGCDVDPTALSTASKRLENYIGGKNYESLPLFVPVQSNFCDLASVLPSIQHPITQEPILPEDGVDGILLDLGVSSHQIDTAERGFAFMKDGPLDMRMSAGEGNEEFSPASVTSQGGMGFTAADICNEFDEFELQRILKMYGDEPRAKKIARSIVEHRPLATTGHLIEAVAAVTPERAKSKRMGRTASLARVFQSLRIVVNQEDMVLEKALLEMSPALIRPGGHLVVLSYHSMEDRAAKRAIRDGTVKAQKRRVREERDIYGNYIGIPRPWKSIGKRIKAREEEVAVNVRARSATLRVGERQISSEKK